MRKSTTPSHIALTMEQAGKLNQSINYAQAILTLIQHNESATINDDGPNDYTVTILLAMGIVAIPAKGFKHYQQAEKALPPLKAVMPSHHFEIVKFCDTALYKRNQQEGKL